MGVRELVVSQRDIPSDIKVLVVDHNPFHRAMFIDVVRNLGVSRIHSAINGLDALEVMRSRKFDVIFTEWLMPDLGGLEMTRLIRRSAEEYDRTVAIILVSSVTMKEEVMEIRNAGVDEIVAKPITGSAVRSRLYEIVYNRRPFIEAKMYVGPCRRRMRGLDYRGARRRVADGDRGQTSIALVSSALMGAMKRMAVMLADASSNEASYRAAKLVAQEIQAIALALNNEAVVSTAQSLMTYLNAIGRSTKFDHWIVEQHLNAMATMKGDRKASPVEQELADVLSQAVAKRIG